MNALTRPASRTSLEPATLGEAIQFASMLAKSSMVPKDFQGKPENVLVAIQWGREVGLGPLQALQNIAVINGRPSIWGDAALALVRAHPDCLAVVETVDGQGDAMTARCEVRRRGEPPVVQTFDVSDAKKANLWGKAGPWQQYPRRMLQQRARGFAIRDAFPDALRGIVTVEEARDTPPEPFKGTTIDVPVSARDAEPFREPGPDYPFQTRVGGKVYATATEWIDAWRRLIQNCQAAKAPDKLRSARDLNGGAFIAVREFDERAVQDVQAMLADALMPADEPGAHEPADVTDEEAVA